MSAVLSHSPTKCVYSDLQDLCDKQAVEIARQREVIEAWFDVSAKAERRQIALETALRELLEASEMSDRDMERHEYETVLEDAQRRARAIVK